MSHPIPQIGRTSPADIVVPIPTVSTRHAVVRVTDASGAAAGSVQVRRPWSGAQPCRAALVTGSGESKI